MVNNQQVTAVDTPHDGLEGLYMFTGAKEVPSHPLLQAPVLRQEFNAGGAGGAGAYLS
jgi:hypothetical protein